MEGTAASKEASFQLHLAKRQKAAVLSPLPALLLVLIGARNNVETITAVSQHIAYCHGRHVWEFPGKQGAVEVQQLV